MDADTTELTEPQRMMIEAFDQWTYAQGNEEYRSELQTWTLLRDLVDIYRDDRLSAPILRDAFGLKKPKQVRRSIKAIVKIIVSQSKAGFRSTTDR